MGGGARSVGELGWAFGGAGVAGQELNRVDERANVACPGVWWEVGCCGQVDGWCCGGTRFVFNRGRFCGCWDGRWFWALPDDLLHVRLVCQQRVRGCGRGGHSPAPGRITLTRWNVALAILLGFLFLDQIDVSLHDDALVLVVVFGLSGGGALFLDLDVFCDLASLICAAGAAFLDVDSPLCGIRNHSSNVGSTQDGSATQFLPATCRKHFPSLCRCSCLPPGLVHRYPLTAEPLALGKESFSRITLPDQSLMLIPQLVPECMEMLIVRSVDVMAQFMQHRVGDLFDWKELPFVSGVSETKADLLVAVDVQAKKIGLGWIEFTKRADAPIPLTHDGFDE